MIKSKNLTFSGYIADDGDIFVRLLYETYVRHFDRSDVSSKNCFLTKRKNDLRTTLGLVLQGKVPKIRIRSQSNTVLFIVRIF